MRLHYHIPLFGLVFVACGPFSVPGPLEAQQEGRVTVRDAIEGLESFVSAIRSYDVIVKAERRFTAVFRLEDGADHLAAGTKSRGHWEKLPPGQAPKTSIAFTRQVLSSDGRCRFERLDGMGKSPQESEVFTGQTTRVFSSKTNTGSIRKRGPDKMPFAETHQSYPALFREMFGGGALVDFFRQRDAGNVSVSNGEAPTDVVLSAKSQKDAKMYPAYCVRVVLDRAHGFGPKRIDLFDEDFVTRRTRFDIDEFVEVGPGVWAPVRATVYQGQEDFTKVITTLTVDKSRSSWNKPLSDDLFVLKFPSGAMIADETRGVSLIAGSGDPGTHIENLVKDARAITGTTKPTPAPTKPSNWLRAILFVATGLLIAGAATWWGLTRVRALRR